MPIDLTVETEPEQCREVARFLRSRLSGSVRDRATDIQRVRADSEHCWQAGSADEFRERLRVARDQSDEMADMVDDAGRKVDDYAEAMATVLDKMSEARSVAAEAGLTTTATSIAEPGQAPPEPGQQATQHAEAVEAQAVYARQVAAYRQAGHIQQRARSVQAQAESELSSGLERSISWTFTAFGFLTDLVGETYKRYSPYKLAAQTYAQNAEAARRLKTNSMMSENRQTSAAVRELVNRVKTERAEARANPHIVAKTVNKLPDWAGKTITASPDRLVVRSSPRILKYAKPALKRFPATSVILTSVEAGVDIFTGKPVNDSLGKAGTVLAFTAAAGALTASAPLSVTVAVGTGASLYGAFLWEHREQIVEENVEAQKYPRAH